MEQRRNMASPKRLKRIAIWVTVVPLLISLLSQCLIWLIPNCNPTPYSVEQCVVAGHQFGPYVMAGLLGGVYVAVLPGASDLCAFIRRIYDHA
jgi:hypothetical protein